MSLARRPFLAFAGLALLPVAHRAAAGTLVNGSGVAATQQRDIGAFIGVGLGAPFAVVLRQGAREAIEIVADDNILALVQTRLEGAGSERSLQIDLPRGTRVEARTPVVVTIDYVRLEHLAVGGSGGVAARSMKSPRLDAAIGGSGGIDLGDLDAGNLTVAIGGNGTFRADGKARTLSVTIGGSGRCDAEALVASDVSVSVAGSGTTRVRAETALRASIAGSGDVYHSGAAIPQVAIIGSGRVKRI
jgi:Putative auto-transporter adhesin, head GIN domain